MPFDNERLSSNGDEGADFDVLTQALPPSHILQDGKFVFLPPPTKAERIRFFERSITRQGLLQGYLNDSKDEVKSKSDDTKKIHPLALASAHLQSEGVSSLNSSINLEQLVATNEYFGLTNIVDPALEQAATSDRTQGGDVSSNTAEGRTVVSAEREVSQRIKASLVWNTKASQFGRATKELRRHRQRLAKVIVAQQQPDRRLRHLRHQWRLVAPEHGTRALPHAARPTEVLAADVDLHGSFAGGLGRLASRVPRYATINLKKDFKVDEHVKKWTAMAEIDQHEEGDGKEAMDLEIDKFQSDSCEAEAFAIADPTLGKIDTDFDPSKVSVLTLQLSIEKRSTGFCESACMNPITYISSTSESKSQDEDVLVKLQHSLFCSKLFESIRRELTPDKDENGQPRANSNQTSNRVWLSCESNENFSAPASFGSSLQENADLTPLAVMHGHEGEVFVQLDCEYSMSVKLINAENQQQPDGNSGIQNESGSQTASSIQLLCQTLLHHAQRSYHQHLVEVGKRQQADTKADIPAEQLIVRRKVTVDYYPHILRKVVSLGCKILFERRIRKTLENVKHRLEPFCRRELRIEWLPLSPFGNFSQFVVSFRHVSLDASLVGEEVTVTQFSEEGFYQKSKFYSATEFGIFLDRKVKNALGQN